MLISPRWLSLVRSAAASPATSSTARRLRHATSWRAFSIPSSQSAIVVDAARCPELGPGALALTSGHAVPVCAAGEVLIAVAYAGVNRPDIMQRKGLYPPPPTHSPLLGLEVSGCIVGLGAGVQGLEIGQEVCALTPGGGYSQFALAPAGSVLAIPGGMTLRDAAALPETFFTVYYNLFIKGQLGVGETVLVHGGAGGIGSTAIQMAKALGSSVFTTAGSEDKCRLCGRLGADLVINYSTHDFVAEVKKRMGKGRGVDVVLDMVGGDYINRNLKILATGGRHVSIAFQQGSTVKVDLLPVLTRGLVLTASTMRPRSAEEKAEIAAGLRKRVWPLIEQKHIWPVVQETLALKDAAEAHLKLETGQVMGKLVLQV